MSSWYATAMGYIKQQQLENPHLDHQQMRKYCSKNYPFDQRSGYAYKAWLAAMRDVFGRTKPKPKAEGQGELL